MSAACKPRGGLLVDTRKGRLFIGAELAASVSWLSDVVPVPGMQPAAEGIAFADDRLVTVLSLGDEPGRLAVVCEVDGGWVALAGIRVVTAGSFEAYDDGAVAWRGERVPCIDAAAIMAEAETSIWRARTAREEGPGS
jgi:chemotaxis signal transduction protein